MSAIKVCTWCGASFFGDRRHKYCSEQCAKDAHREQCKLRFRQRFAERHEEELARNRAYYAAHRDKSLARTGEYFRAHPDKQREYNRRKYAKMKANQ